MIRWISGGIRVFYQAFAQTFVSLALLTKPCWCV